MTAKKQPNQEDIQIKKSKTPTSQNIPHNQTSPKNRTSQKNQYDENNDSRNNWINYLIELHNQESSIKESHKNLAIVSRSQAITIAVLMITTFQIIVNSIIALIITSISFTLITIYYEFNIDKGQKRKNNNEEKIRKFIDEILIYNYSSEEIKDIYIEKIQNDKQLNI